MSSSKAPRRTNSLQAPLKNFLSFFRRGFRLTFSEHPVSGLSFLQVAMVGIGFNFVSTDDDLILSVKLKVQRLRATIDTQTADTLLMEANEGCYAIPAVVLAELLDTDYPSTTLEFNFYRRKRTKSSTSSLAGAPSKKRKRPEEQLAQESDSNTQRRREGPVLGAPFSLFIHVGR